MSPIRLPKRLLSAAALAATGMSAEAAADDLEPAVEASERSDPQVDLARLPELVDGVGPVDPGLAAVLVATALASAHPLERIAFVCEWATSASVVRRRALARALNQPFSCAGAVTAIEVLARDQDLLVRTAARDAALLRLGHDPERYAALLEG